MNQLWFLSNQPQQGMVTYLLKLNTFKKNLNLILPDSFICSFFHFQRDSIKWTGSPGERRGVRNVSPHSPLKVIGTGWSYQKVSKGESKTTVFPNLSTTSSERDQKPARSNNTLLPSTSNKTLSFLIIDLTCTEILKNTLHNI